MSLFLQGVGTALVTPFKDDAVDYEAFEAMVRRQTESGVDFLVPLGSTAETPCLEDDEKVRLLALTRSLAGGRPVVAGAGTNSLRHTIRTMNLLEPCGPDAFLIVVPYYNKPTQEGMYRYFRAVAESTDKAIVLYNVPGRTGANLSAQTCLRLAHDVPNIVAVKEASGNKPQVEAILRGRPEGFSVLSGNDEEALDVMEAGGQGVISVVSNLVPATMASMNAALREGRRGDAEAIRDSLLPLCDACFVESNPIPVKAGLSLLGLCSPEMRLPLTPATPETAGRMKECLKELEML